RRPVLDDFELTDESGVPLELDITAYPHAIFIQTRIGEFWLTFLDEETLYLKLPKARGGVSFRVFALNGRTDRRGGTFKGDPEHRSTHRNVAYSTNACLRDNVISESDNGYTRVAFQFEGEDDSALTLNITPRLGFNRTVSDSARVLQAAETRWHKWF